MALAITMATCPSHGHGYGHAYGSYESEAGEGGDWGARGGPPSRCPVGMLLRKLLAMANPLSQVSCDCKSPIATFLRPGFHYRKKISVAIARSYLVYVAVGDSCTVPFQDM